MKSKKLKLNKIEISSLDSQKIVQGTGNILGGFDGDTNIKYDTRNCDPSYKASACISCLCPVNPTEKESDCNCLALTYNNTNCESLIKCFGK